MSMIIRGGILGCMQISLFKKMVNFMDEPFKMNSLQMKSVNSQNESIHQFMTRVQDDNEILSKLIMMDFYH